MWCVEEKSHKREERRCSYSRPLREKLFESCGEALMMGGKVTGGEVGTRLRGWETGRRIFFSEDDLESWLP